MDILFVQVTLNKKVISNNSIFDLDTSMDFMEFKYFMENMDKLKIIFYDYILIEVSNNDKETIEQIKIVQNNKIVFLTNIIFLFEDLSFTNLSQFVSSKNTDFIVSSQIKEILRDKISLYKKQEFDYVNYKMALKGKLLRTLEHQWKQPLNFIATNFLNLELKAELGKLENEDIQSANLKVEKALEQVSSSLSKLNKCFAQSEKKEHLSLKNLITDVLKFIKPQMEKHGILIEKLNFEDEEIYTYENEFSLLLLAILYIYVHFLISIKASKKEKFLSISKQNDSLICLKINQKLFFLELYEEFLFEFIIVKKILKRLGLSCKVEYEEDNTKLILTIQ